MEREADVIRHQFALFRAAFRAVNQRAGSRFRRRDWAGLQADSVERLDLYRQAVQRAVTGMGIALGDGLEERPVWVRLKAAYAALVAPRDDRELAETFFNSVTRRIFSTVGVDPSIEFVDSDFDEPAGPGAGPAVQAFARAGRPLSGLLRAILMELGPHLPYASLDEDAEAAARRLEADLHGGAWSMHLAEMAACIFYRNKAAYVVGRLTGPLGNEPLALALLHEPAGVTLDAVLLGERALHRVFSFTRSYFLVESERPGELVAFLKALMPGKPVAELYIALGFNKHGKTQLYRDLLRHLRESDDAFIPAPGQPGMVMAVFTLARYDLVFKVIRDRFAEPKSTTRAEVVKKYDLVFRHDRAGRLIDAQEFEHVAFERARFAPSVLQELLSTCSETVALQGEQVVIRHLYAERRLTPLDLYLRDNEPEAGREALLDYGQAVRDLASTGIFPGDILLKNFGVTRQKRVVFYDYDELTLLRDCNFRELPESDAEEHQGGEAWFYVSPRDIFPEEFVRFLGLPEPSRRLLLEAHGELFTAGFWRGVQARLAAGELLDVFPYAADERLPRPR